MGLDRAEARWGFTHMTRFRIIVFVATTITFYSALCGSEPVPLPTAEFEDAITATDAELAALRNWVSESFLDRFPSGDAAPIRIDVPHQDHSVLGYGQSCIETPIRVGSRSFEHGLGTHANSEIVVSVPAGAMHFHALVGIDNNADTAGMMGSVQFSVEIGGEEVFRSATLTGKDEGVAVDVTIPEGTRQIVLKTDATEDGTSHDQADWADAQFLMNNGPARYLDEVVSPLLFLDREPPFSFRYGGADSREFLKTWTRESESQTLPDRRTDQVRWMDPATGLRVTAIVTTYARHAAVDWLLNFENTGVQDTPIIEDIQTLDTRLRTGYMRRLPVLHELEGDACGERTFVPKTTRLEAGKSLQLAPTGGRPSSISAFPFFNIEYEGRGIIAAIGWTGQWAAQFDRAENGPTRFRAGMEHTRFLLHAGEQVRTPRIVLLPWEGDRRRAHNQFRRLMLFKYFPSQDGAPARLPVALQTYDRYNARPGWATEAGQLEAVGVAQRLGFDTYWFDAAWFPGNFPNGVGNWFCKPDAFPNGLKPVGDACRDNDMRFILWFEPERVAPGTQIAEEHPQFVLGGKDGGLFNLGDPDARRWLTELLSQRITEYGVTFYRNDFNIDPLSYWQKNDAPDREGISEIRYVEGLYAMWDELRERHPGLLIDNCSSGGRRIDIEMCMRSVPLWRSDTNCTPGHADWNQQQTATLSTYVPLHTACVWTPDTYEARSAGTGGLLCQFAYLDPDFPMDRAAALVAEARANGPYWYGDFYPLTPASSAPDQFMAYQLHRPDLDAGIALAFRHPDCEHLGLVVGLNALRPETTYRVEIIDESGETTTETQTGAELAQGLVLRIPEKGSSLLIRYAPTDG